MYKIPFRHVYADNLVGWAKCTFWCHVVIRVFPHGRDLGSDALVPMYIDRPESFFEQYEGTLRDIAGERAATLNAAPAAN